MVAPYAQPSALLLQPGSPFGINRGSQYHMPQVEAAAQVTYLAAISFGDDSILYRHLRFPPLVTHGIVIEPQDTGAVVRHKRHSRIHVARGNRVARHDPPGTGIVAHAQLGACAGYPGHRVGRDDEAVTFAVTQQ